MKLISFVVLSITILFSSCSKDSNPFKDENPSNEIITITDPQLIIKDGKHPAWSPDGSTIAFTAWSNETKEDIFIAQYDGSNRQQVTNRNLDENHPFWSPDGRSIGFSSNMNNDQNYCIFTISLDSKEIFQISPDTFAVQAGDWAPNLPQIVFDGQSKTHHTNALSIVDLTENTIMSFTLELQYEGWPQYSPDGSKIVFEALDKISTQYNIWTINADGTGLKQITISGGEYPCWSSDGNWISYSNNISDNYELFIIDSDGKSQPIQVINSKDANEVRAAWSPSGEFIIYDTMMGTNKISPKNAGIYLIKIQFLE